MRKILLALFMAFGISTLAHAQATKIVFTWSDSANASIPACTGTVTTSCLTAFTLTDTTANTVVSSTIASNLTTYTYTPTGGIPFGYNHSFSLVVTGKDSSGNVITSPAATTSVTYSVLGAPTGFSGVAQ
jgi:hypothetical protein